MKHPYIPYGRQYIDEEDIQAVVEVLKSDFLTTGPKIHEFEKKVADYVGCKYAVCIGTGTAALHAACYAANISADDEVITTPMTFAATSNSILYLGGKPVFADIDPHTYNIDPLEIEKKITNKTKAIIAVDFTGQPAELFKIKDLAQRHNLIFIEDASHSLGAEIMDSKGTWHKTGGIAHMTTFSFHPVKHITTAEGGMICTNDPKLYEKLTLFRTHGITRSPELLTDKSHDKWYYEQQLLGYNYRLSDLQAALGISQLNKLDSFIKRRREIAALYDKAFSESTFKNKITIPYQTAHMKSSYHIYILKFNLSAIGKSREEIFNKLSDLNVGVNVHYIPVYYHPYYQSLGYSKGLCPIAEKLYEDIITIPLYPGMSNEDVNYVIKSIKEV
ncbi:UDP-4-amino-4,6-dideoxy-N-acetyl-beta-L-altrosamine transaminase [Clostridium sp. OS1-26]|uniref:UDP-4-amino-4, 6-dideoxy-N-acetyl-beta-L-altrosamine transaminase n=1 Tax=Clostridium sp. OS1-26 TaxID=3070681 RepID=UPI0027E0F3FF|nr:UDP-4-amino-4,6-dideoxy-N-acetyl-beta-L-altrosamine transaminase [Clostridium sp. OS1-26]WML32754.1 UDP-4-amino-4,6-dideoxy-N-acetyl-beta-L-altrosamine transaminase [Clostridium sp. OS1-26]